ncbi:hypothetical protein LXL04_026165 [Taraxacum kok-saghyz]
MVLTIWELRKGLKHPHLDKAYEATDNYFTLKLHYGCVFTKVPDIDLFSVHDINEMVRDIGYLTETPLFYQYCKPNICLDYGLIPLGNDQDVLTMTTYIPRHREIYVYIETGETTTFIYDKSSSKVIIEELDEPTQVSQVSQVINPQVEALVEIVVEVVIEDVDPDIGAGHEQGLGQHVENDMFAELEDMIDHDYSIGGDINGQYNVIQASEDEITVLHENSEGESDESSAFVLDEGWGEGEGEGQGEGVGECEGEGEGQDSLDTNFFVQDSNLHFDVDVDMSMRDFLGFDGTFMKGPFPGQILTVVGLDSNNGIYPLAYAVVEAETFQSWTWFLELLGEDLTLGPRSNFTFISDRQKVWKCGRATTINHFQRAMDELKEMHERVHHALSVIPASSWTKSHFSGRAHTDCLLNNLSEVFNSKIEDARDQPIITCLEYIREYLMKRLCVVQAAINKCETLLTPTATQLFEVIKKEAARYIAQYNGAWKYQVGCPWQDQYVVDLNDRSCTCRN